MCHLCGNTEGQNFTYSKWYTDYLQRLGQYEANQRKQNPKPGGRRPTYKEEKMPEIEATRTGGVEKELVTFRVKRTIDGLKVMVKSEVLAKFFEQYKATAAQLGGEAQIQKIPKWGNLTIWRTATLPTVADVTFDRPGEMPMVNDYIANLSFLRAEKLAEGIEFTIKGVFSKSQAEGFYNAARSGIKELFVEYLESTDMEYTLTGRSSL